MRAILVAALLTLGCPALAQAPAPNSSCGTTLSRPPPELAGWSERAKAYASADPKIEVRINLNDGVDAMLRVISAVRFAAPPERAPGKASYGGMFSLAIQREGTYRVALGAPAWIDVVRDGRIIASTRHGHGPDCTGIRKMVDFPLQPGNYVVQLSDSASPYVALLVTDLR